ncbi:thymidine kinase [uncultured Murdochiella sp.]|uniref:thymidine kinase n=1 Tax=uncultured Murdochiella sp. TaxID=1586095 RepID=UPI002805E437|nr:thymidine kinase [uncultured Murdochiella sp.]
MAKLYFRYGAMNSGKSTLLLQVAYNYEERGMHVLLLKPGVDTKGEDEIVSRLGVRRRVDRVIAEETDCRTLVQEERKKRPIDCILVDEAQFLSPRHVEQLFAAVMDTRIPCICYGLRTDFRGEGFPGSQRLLELAHSLEELKTICHCGRKAIMNIRRVNGKTVFEGDQVCIDNSATIEYEAVCGQCFLAERRKVGEVPLASLNEDYPLPNEE